MGAHHAFAEGLDARRDLSLRHAHAAVSMRSFDATPNRRRTSISMKKTTPRVPTHPLAQSHGAQDDSARTIELPAVVLGETQGQGDGTEGAPSQRLLQGRVRQSLIFYPIYLLLVVSGAIAANVAVDTQEWSFGVVVVAWTTMFFWYQIYVVAWTYGRRMLKWFCIIWLLLLTTFMAVACYDRGMPQDIFTSTLIQRPGLPLMMWASGMLAACQALFVSHLVYFGRGYRKKRSSPEDA